MTNNLNTTVSNSIPNNELVRVKVGHRTITGHLEDFKVFDHSTGNMVVCDLRNLKGKYLPVWKKMPRSWGTFGNRDFGWFIGEFLSDGWVTGSTVGFSKLEQCKREKFLIVTRNEFPCEFALNEYHEKKGGSKLGDSVKIHMNSKLLAESVRNLNLYNNEAKALGDDDARSCIFKQIPLEFILNGSEEFLWGLFSGLLDGDGSAVINTFQDKPRYSFRFSTSSPYLRDSVVALCLRLGLDFSITTSPPRNKSREAYVVCFSCIDVYKSLHKIQCCGGREQHVLNSFAGNSPRGRSLRIPITSGEFTNLKNLTLKAKKNTDYSSISSYKTYITTCILENLKKMPTMPSWLVEVITRRLDSNIIWLPIKAAFSVSSEEVTSFDTQLSKLMLL